MSFADRVSSVYRRGVTQQVRVRRFSGTGNTRTSADYPASPAYARARVIGQDAAVLAGESTENRYVAIVLVDDLVGLSLPLTTADKLIFEGRELAIEFPDDATVTADGDLIAYRLRAIG